MNKYYLYQELVCDYKVIDTERVDFKDFGDMLNNYDIKLKYWTNKVHKLCNNVSNRTFKLHSSLNVEGDSIKPIGKDVNSIWYTLWEHHKIWYEMLERMGHKLDKSSSNSII